MAIVRVFLLTCRRPHLLRRALESLRAQTLTDWICELHNDAPDDASPRRLVEELADPRITLHHHDHNWGAVSAMRHAYAGGAEPFASLLEDDNWWEPGFLAAALAALAARSDAALAWANMRLWHEAADGRWRDLKRNIWSVDDSAPMIREFRWPELYQAFDALHSHGAMVFRPGSFSSIPTNTPLAIIEAVRERAARGSLLFLSAPLANFAVTQGTARSADRADWLQCKLLLGCSFFLQNPVAHAQLAALWQAHRQRQPRDTGILFVCALVLHRWSWLANATAGDWVAFIRGLARHPGVTLRALRFRRNHAELWSWLLAHPNGAENTSTASPSATVLEKTSAAVI